MTRARTALLLLTLLLATTATAQEDPGVYVAPEQVDAGEPISFLLVFPADATGDAKLEVGDGRTETVNAAVGEVEIPLDAPERNGTYTARLRYTTPGGDVTHEATYAVGEAGPGDEESPVPVWILLATLAMSARRYR